MKETLINNAFTGSIATGIAYALGCVFGAMQFFLFETIMWICAVSMTATAILSIAIISIDIYETRWKKENDWR